MKIFAVCIFLVSAANAVYAQDRVFTKSGVITFSAGTPLEDIDAINKSVTSVIDITTGQAEFAALVKGFEFKRSLMQEHFNENYLESEKFPKAVFKGSIQNISTVVFSKDGSYPVVVKGRLEIHGVSKDVEAPATLVVTNKNVTGESDFVVTLSDYDIRIPQAVADKISPTVKIHISCSYKPL